MDILDILLDILLKPPQPLMGLFLMIPGPFEYFSENGWSQKITFYSETDGPYLDIQIWF